MKKSIILILALFSLTSVFAKYPVLSRDAKNGGIFGYNRTKSTPTTYTVGDGVVIGYDVTCLDPGISSCPKLGHFYRPVGGGNEDGWDQVQIDKADYLVEYALQQILNKNLSGSYTIQVQVQGETKMRVYEVIWSATSADALTSTITVNRDDI